MRVGSVLVDHLPMSTIMSQVYASRCSAGHDEGGSSAGLRTDLGQPKMWVSPPRSQVALNRRAVKSLGFKLVDEGLGKAGDYPFRDVEAEGLLGGKGVATCVSSQL
jgi:hypothetical protein